MTAMSSSSELKFQVDQDSEHVRFILPPTKFVLSVVNSLDGVWYGFASNLFQAPEKPVGLATFWSTPALWFDLYFALTVAVFAAGGGSRKHRLYHLRHVAFRPTTRSTRSTKSGCSMARRSSLSKKEQLRPWRIQER
jgi:hypothetical protein